MQVARFTDVGKRFGQKRVLQGLSFEIEPGEILSLLGRNGAGKTTAVRLLLGLSRPSEGVVEVCGRSPESSDARKNIGAMLQVARLREALRPKELVHLFSTYYDTPLSYREVAEIAGLEEFENDAVQHLSGGQKQRVAFAVAICGNPKLLVLDEPTAGLDAESRRRLWHSIRAFRQRGAAVLLTTHYLHEADALADRVLVLQGGAVCHEGTPAELKRRTGLTDFEDVFLELIGADTHAGEGLR